MILLKEILMDIVEDELKKVAKKIKHCGDCGDLFYNESKKKVWWSAGDADIPEEGYTDIKEIERMFYNIPCIKEVEIGDEAWPDGDEDGWKPIFYDNKMNPNRYL